ncbi:MAG: two-component sensor histidine kinase, partial [Paenibacillaceae bacterium]|nr:two-component sensor histidine kinase [Paenibacillaceae bacterium]
VSVTIADTGVGIAAEQLPFLFDRFSRVEESRSRHTGGMGLGLAIAKEFVEAHSGFITVLSELGRGTQFTVDLPCTV